MDVRFIGQVSVNSGYPIGYAGEESKSLSQANSHHYSPLLGKVAGKSLAAFFEPAIHIFKRC